MGNLNNLKNVNFLKQSDHLRHWIDYLRLNFDRPIHFFEEKLSWLVDNSSFIVEDWRTYTKMSLGSWLTVMASYSYNGQSFPLLMYNVFITGQYEKYARMDFYGTFFRFINMGEFPPDYFKTYIENLTTENPVITRIDYCVDLFYNDIKDLPERDTIIQNINDKTKWYIITVWKRHQSWSLGSKLNKRFIIRMYDKLDDIMAKWKLMLFGDYLKYKSVHRFEIEFGSKFCRGYTLNELSLMLAKINSFFGITDDFYTWTVFYKYERKFEINERTRDLFVKHYMSATIKLFEANINPYLLGYEWISTYVLTKYDNHRNLQYLKEIIKIPAFREYKTIKK